jgi:hypothetical protein
MLGQPLALVGQTFPLTVPEGTMNAPILSQTIEGILDGLSRKVCPRCDFFLLPKARLHLQQIQK